MKISQRDARRLRKRVEELEANMRLRAANRWIPVSARLPERETLCLIRTKEPEIRLVRMGRDCWWESPNRRNKYFNFEDVIDWRKVEPPEEG